MNIWGRGGIFTKKCSGKLKMGNCNGCFERTDDNSNITAEVNEDPTQATMTEKPPVIAMHHDESFDGFAKQFGFIGQSQRLPSRAEDTNNNSLESTGGVWNLFGEGRFRMVVHGWFIVHGWFS